MKILGSQLQCQPQLCDGQIPSQNWKSPRTPQTAFATALLRFFIMFRAAHRNLYRAALRSAPLAARQLQTSAAWCVVSVRKPLLRDFPHVRSAL
eukprot:scaffold576_cov260-Pinguiococcus_pyrenoidosus.AAC.88